MKTKICSKCKTELPATTEYFYCDKCQKDGLYPQCKKCQKEYHKKWRENNKEYNKKYYKENKNQIKIQQQEYYEENRKEIIEYGKNYYEENKEERLKYDKEYNQRPALYDTFASQIEWCEKIRRNKENSDLLEVTCTKCKTWFDPTNIEIQNRIRSINGKLHGNTEARFYCSDKCKNSCEIYHKSAKGLMKDHAIKAGRIPWHHIQRELQPELRAIVLERDNYTCHECGSTDNLECHHIVPVVYDPIESADIDICIILCEECHKEVHKLPGCRLGEIRKNSVLQECYT